MLVSPGGQWRGARRRRGARLAFAFAAMAALAGGCGGDDDAGVDPDTAPRATIDRFSDAAGTMMRRSTDATLPAAGAAIDFDARFITHGLGPSGQPVSYYNFDVQPREPAPIYVLFKPGATEPVPGQINIVDVKPGDAGYSDFWHVQKVTVPEDYTPNTVTSLADIQAAQMPIESMNKIVNCPLVPEGSTASMRANGGGTELHAAWYKGEVVHYFEFAEADLAPVPDGIFAGLTPFSYIFVSFNINPGESGGGPPSGAKTEAGTTQTHNVVETIPGDPEYSPLWLVYIYDNAEFDSVTDITSAKDATILETVDDLVNCPVASVGSLAAPVDPS